MNSIQLTNFFTGDTFKNFGGVFASDELPSKIKLTTGIIVNTAPRSSPGEHWIAIYISEIKSGYYFDSFGLPAENSSIISFLRKHCETIDYNKKQIQHLKSIKCGQFAAVYLKLRFAGASSNHFINLFNTNLDLNESIINSYFNYFIQ
jgi:Adenovirus endoprotease